jgi:tetratricopeptide (TPR) repeat protein
MIHPFPLFTAVHSLSRQDFSNFSLPFAKAIKEKIATATDVSFLDDAKQLAELSVDESTRSFLNDFFAGTIQTYTPAAFNDSLLLPFSVHDEQFVVALVSGIDPLLAKKVGHDWLQEIRDTLQREFLTIKQAGIDPQTGLLGSTHLHTLFDTLIEKVKKENVGLALIEIYPQVRTAMEAMQHLRRAASALRSFVGEHAPLYHLGQSVFAFACPDCNEDSATRFGPLLVSFLKREHFNRVHIGYSQGKIDRDRQGETRKILDEAWLALQVACKRGPFSFCTHQSLQHSQRHALYATDRAALNRLQPHWQQLDQFALIQLLPETTTDTILELITLPLAGSKKIKGKENDAYVLLPIADPRKVLSLVRKMIQSITTDSRKIKGTVAAGIALFPCSDFKKSEMVLNCRKALLHGDLLGKGQLTVFDALSLNVSGDIFYGVGDIPRAVKEYRRGLLLQPQDVNLLNSLGVCYAMMNRHRIANDCFLKALAIQNDDFMSWYNLGLGREAQGNISGAVESFEHAYKCHKCPPGDEQESTNVRAELPFQLGKLYCQTGRYQEAFDILFPWHTTQASASGAGRALRYLGESLHGVGRTQEAMSWLQRAIRFDEFDADALSLLGEIYLDQNEGDLIALKLCEKSVELNPTPVRFHLHLARAQIQCGFLEAARESLRCCLSDQGAKGAAWFQMGLLCQKQGQILRARHWFTKTLHHEGSGATWHQQASKHLSDIQEKKEPLKQASETKTGLQTDITI